MSWTSPANSFLGSTELTPSGWTRNRWRRASRGAALPDGQSGVQHWTISDPGPSAKPRNQPFRKLRGSGGSHWPGYRRHRTSLCVTQESLRPRRGARRAAPASTMPRETQSCVCPQEDPREGAFQLRRVAHIVLGESASPGTAQKQRRVAGVSAQDLHEVGRVRETGATPDLRRRQTIEER